MISRRTIIMMTYLKTVVGLQTCYSFFFVVMQMYTLHHRMFPQSLTLDIKGLKLREMGVARQHAC